MSYLLEFAERKLSLASALSTGALGGSYGDSILIISSLLAASAAHFWPGKRIDKLRFVEIWSRYADATLSPSLVSVPLLLQTLRQQGHTSAVKALEATNPKAFSGNPEMDDLVITGDDVDLEEEEIRSLLAPGGVSLRSHSYPAIFYEEVRSAYVHEYSVGPSASAHPGALAEAFVSYTNNVASPYRRIHFGVSGLIDVARSVIRAIEPVWDSAPPFPSVWRLEG